MDKNKEKPHSRLALKKNSFLLKSPKPGLRVPNPSLILKLNIILKSLTFLLIIQHSFDRV